MSFIRVTLRGSNKKVDINSTHILTFGPGEVKGVESGSNITLVTDELLLANESPRQLRSFIKKAQGSLPAPAES